jgi:hypothetical protein
VAISPHSELWRNLSAVHRQIGEANLAELAQHEAVVAQRHETDAAKAGKLVASSDVRWVEPGTFAETTRPVADWQRPGPVAGGAAPTTEVARSASPRAPLAASTSKRNWWPFGGKQTDDVSPGLMRR